MTVPPEVLGEQLTRDGIETVQEGRLVIACPRSERQIGALLTRAGRDSLRVAPAGLLSKISGLRPEVMEGDIDLVLSLRNLNKVVDFVPGDGTLTAQAGCIWSDLNRTVHESGFELPADLPLPARTTLGGALGSGMSGPDRLRRGPLRHHVLGAHVILSDGTRAKSGGRLVKNVTGFDLHRLYTGSRGTLCVLVEASLRLFPSPEETCALTRPCADAAEAFLLAEDLRRRYVDPLSVTIEGGAREPWRLHVVFTGRRVEMPSTLARASEVLGDAQRLDGAQAHNLSAELRDRVCHGGAWPQLRLSGPPARAHLAHAMLQRQLGSDPMWRLVAQPGVATLEVFAPLLAASTVADQVSMLTELRATLADSGHRLEPVALPGGTHLELAADLEGDPARRWMRNLLRRYDPLSRFASPAFPGRAPTHGATS
jgi:FAD/FMN-containing dehydrogenase